MRNILRQIIVVFATGALLLLVNMEGALGSEVMGSAADFRVNDAQPRTAYFANTAQREAAALLGFKIPDALASGATGTVSGTAILTPQPGLPATGTVHIEYTPEENKGGAPLALTVMWTSEPEGATIFFAVDAQLVVDRSKFIPAAHS